MIRVIALLLYVSSGVSVTGQGFAGAREYGYYERFGVIEDSILRHVGTRKHIRLQMHHSRTIIIYHDSLQWAGYLLQNNNDSEVPLPETVYVDGNGVAHTERIVQTTLFAFNADSIYHELVNAGLLRVKQYTYEEIDRMYTRLRSNKKGVMYAFAPSSHDAIVTLTISDPKIRVEYFWSYITKEELQFIETIYVMNRMLRLFYDFRRGN